MPQCAAAKPGAGPDAQAALAHDGQPIREGRREVHHAGHAGRHQFRIGQAHRGRLPRLVDAKRLQAFEQPRHLLFGHAMILAHAARRGFGRRMRVDVHQAGHDQHAPAIHHLGAVGRRRVGVVAGDGGDAPALDQHIHAARVSVVFSGRIPHHRPGGVADQDRCGHGVVSFIVRGSRSPRWRS
jgi:hypothetical protein